MATSRPMQSSPTTLPEPMAAPLSFNQTTERGATPKRPNTSHYNRQQTRQPTPTDDKQQTTQSQHDSRQTTNKTADSPHYRNLFGSRSFSATRNRPWSQHLALNRPWTMAHWLRPEEEVPAQGGGENALGYAAPGEVPPAEGAHEVFHDIPAENEIVPGGEGALGVPPPPAGQPDADGEEPPPPPPLVLVAVEPKAPAPGDQAQPKAPAPGDQQEGAPGGGKINGWATKISEKGHLERRRWRFWRNQSTLAGLRRNMPLSGSRRWKGIASGTCATLPTPESGPM